MERSIFTDRYVFAHNCYQNGLMTDLEWQIYQKWFDWLLEEFEIILKPTGYVYLKAEAEISNQRIQKRKRDEESDIPYSYLKLLIYS